MDRSGGWSVCSRSQGTGHRIARVGPDVRAFREHPPDMPTRRHDESGAPPSPPCHRIWRKRSTRASSTRGRSRPTPSWHGWGSRSHGSAGTGSREPAPSRAISSPAGLFHGGGYVVIAETLASMHAAVRSGAPVVGVDLDATHLRSITSGTVYARAQVLHGGRRLFNHEVRMTDADDRLLSIVRISNMVLGSS